MEGFNSVVREEEAVALEEVVEGWQKWERGERSRRGEEAGSSGSIGNGMAMLGEEDMEERGRRGGNKNDPERDIIKSSLMGMTMGKGKGSTPPALSPKQPTRSPFE